MNSKLKSLLPHFIAVGIFLIISMIYFHPALDGYVIKSHDVTTYKGMSKELIDYRADNGEEALWTNSMFGGMPGTQISVETNSGVSYLSRIISLGLPHPINKLFVTMLSFYVLLLSFKVNFKVAIAVAIGFAMSTYFTVIIQAGHLTKSFAIAQMGWALAGVVFAYRGNRLLGAGLFGIAFSLELLGNHLQITYYLGIIVLFFVLSELVRHIIKKELESFITSSVVLLAVALLAIGTNAVNLWGTIEYGVHTTRGESELTNDKGNKTSGLNRDYVTAWSYGKGESFSLMLPYVKGGGNLPLFMLHESSVSDEHLESLSNNKMSPQAKSQIFNQVKNETSYWGNQTFTSGNDYVGIIIVFLAFLAFIFVKDYVKWFLLLLIALSLMLAWGKNLMWFTNFFLDYIPGYNKFRTVSMILVIAELCFPLLAALFLNYLIKNREEVNKKIEYFYIGSGVFFLFLLVLLISPDTFFNFFPNGQGRLTLDYLQQAQPDMSIGQMNEVMQFYNNEYYPFLKEVRISIYQTNILRGLVFFVLSAIVVLGFIKDKLNTVILAVVLGVLILIDMWSINTGYLNNKDYDNGSRFWVESNEGALPYNVFSGDEMIFQLESQGNPIIAQEIAAKIEKAKDESIDGISPQKIAAIRFGVLNKYTNFRVFTVSNPFNESRTSYYYKSLGGYHGAKLKRYQELIDSCLSRNNQKVMDMLNTKYIVQYQTDPNTREQNNTLAQPRNTALGNAWFVNNVKIVQNADEEIVALKEENGFDPENIAIVDKRFNNLVGNNIENRDQSATIVMESYAPNYLVYQSNSSSDQIAIFSEIFYDLGWQAYIDGEPVEHFRANYVLRGLGIPKGKHKIEFKYSLTSYNVATVIQPISFILILLVFGFGIYKLNKPNVAEE